MPRFFIQDRLTVQRRLYTSSSLPLIMQRIEPSLEELQQLLFSHAVHEAAFLSVSPGVSGRPRKGLVSS